MNTEQTVVNQIVEINNTIKSIIPLLTKDQVVSPILEWFSRYDGLLTVFFTMLTLMIVVYQIKLTIDQIKIMKKQDELLARKATLKIVGKYNKEDCRFDFVTENIGNKTAPDCYWHLFVPLSLSYQGNIIIAETSKPITSSGLEIIEGKEYKHFRDYDEKKIYPTRQKVTCNFPLLTEDTKGTFKFYWQVVSEDGVFPEKNEYGFIQIRIHKGFLEGRK